MSPQSRQRHYHRVRFTFQVPEKSPNGEVLLWLLAKEYGSFAKDKALEAVRAFWLPLARKDAGSYSPQELRDIAQLAIWRLEEQILYLRSCFGLPAMAAEILPPAPLLSQPVLLHPEQATAPSKLVASGEAGELLKLEEFDWSIDESELGEAC